MGNVCDYYNKRDRVFRPYEKNPPATRLEWTKLNDTKNKVEEIPIAGIKSISSTGDNDLTILSTGGEKLLELECPSPSVRDVWVETLEEICESVNSESEGHDELIKEREACKKKYWHSRTAELEKRQMEAAEKKKKLGLVGMKYTAQAMSKR
uniref:Uncharacterized protein AlNc14C46G3716 n=1 Tax=Albugo laibachii Nc14 TaxID=890382 RepID=F0WAJ2_9STRA|nr:PREDICTED: hypothetical protein LOC100491319 [Albugo laibachii Nc14]|eukprot:CCA18163.1 PREDICTED: hypothetical protein LOC100491319 [Albugo laibachii Nc14]